ncbi:MAG: endolytic transglycosylase MltG [Proteobacteria bacterium]|nr:endolytic transglycosylase MltG [Pseudomonadota bacterium]NOG59392.1 endolytic transglycosylase MltG [Pseudomonadota bacterium]
MLKRAIRLSILILFFLLATGFLLFQDYQKFLQTPLNIERDFVFTVESGMSFSDLNKKLQSENIVNNTRYLELLARQSSRANKIRTGEYNLMPGILPDELLNIFVSGKVVQYSMILIEGWQIHEMLAAIKLNEILVKKLGSYNPDTLMKELGYPEKSAEGLFFPDTYHFPKGTSDVEFLKRAYDKLQKVLDEEWQNRDPNLPYQSPYEALIMASIIEKETGLASERKTIAGVFVRRLNKNMKLQTDPTVIYAMGSHFNGNIRRKDLKIDSPYNTYRYKGLPPSPISLVGREAIHAALHPEDGKALYFVAKGDGSHYFSESLAEHNRAVVKYQIKKGK